MLLLQSRLKWGSYSFNYSDRIFLYFMFPNPNHSPTFFFIMPIDFFVSLFVSCDFFLPKGLSRCGHWAVFFTTVPKTRIDEYNQFLSYKSDIRLAWQCRHVLSVAKLGLGQFSSQEQLHFGILVLDARHYFASLLFWEGVLTDSILRWNAENLPALFSLFLNYTRTPRSVE